MDFIPGVWIGVGFLISIGPEPFMKSTADRMDKGLVWVVQQKVLKDISFDGGNNFEQVRMGSKGGGNDRV